MKFFSLNLLLGGLLLLATNGFAQSFTAQIALQADRLQPQDQEILSEIPRALEDYINNYRWADDNQDIKVKARINIIVETVTTRGSEKLFRGQLLAQSEAAGNFLDKACEFPYIEGQFMEHQRPVFNSLLSIIDYYIYVLLGTEMDTYIIKGGTPFFDRARNICDEGLISNYSLGWKSRLDDLQLITDGDHIFLRDAMFYFYEGLFYAEERQDRDKTPEYSKKVVELLGQIGRRRPNSKVLKRFLDSHYNEFCTLLKYDANRNNMNQMMQLDNRHSETYESCKLEGKKALQR